MEWYHSTRRSGSRPKVDKGKGKATRTPTPPPRNFDFDKARRDDSGIPEMSEIDVIYPEHNFDPSKVIPE